MGDRGRRIQTQFVVDDEVIADAVEVVQFVPSAQRAFETVQPAKERQTEVAPPATPDLLVNVAFLAPEAVEFRIKARPRLSPASRSTDRLISTFT